MRGIIRSINQSLHVGHDRLLSWMFSCCLRLWCFRHHYLVTYWTSSFWQIYLYASVIVLSIKLYNLVLGIYWVKKNQIVGDISWLGHFIELILSFEINNNVILLLILSIILLVSFWVMRRETESVSRFFLLIAVVNINISLRVHRRWLKRMVHFY